MSSGFEGKVAIVTGAAGGIGAVFARALAERGAAVAICDVAPPSTMIDSLRAAGAKAIGDVADVADRASVERFVAKVTGELGPPQILINNAAVFASIAMRPFEDVSDEEWDRVLSVNIKGPINMVRACLPAMRAATYGKVVNISSGAAFTGPPRLIHYVASKGAGVSTTRALARELGDSGVRVNAIAPGFTLSENVAGGGIYSNAIRDQMVAIRALKREQVPDDLVGAMLFLSGPESDFITGQTLVVDGGSVMR